MPPRFAYWTILVGGLPTAFRSAEREELLPTFKRLREKHPDAAMQWFSRGKLWESPEVAREALLRERMGDERPRDRGRDWRPGGEHRDPRQKFIDAKKERNQDRRKQRFERRHKDDTGTPARTPDRTGPARPDGPSGWTGRPRAPKPEGRRDWKDRPPGPKPEGRRDWKDRPPGPKPEGRRDWKDRPPGPKPEGRRDWKDRPPGPGRPTGPRAPRGPRGPSGPKGPKR